MIVNASSVAEAQQRAQVPRSWERPLGEPAESGSRAILAGRLSRVQPSATGVVWSRAASLRAAGVDVVSFAVGEPDFETPVEIREAAKRAIDQGATRYTDVAGLPELRRAICADSLRRRGVEHGPEEVVVTVGAKHALFNLALALFEEGDEVVTPVPGWVSYPEQALLVGATPVRVECSEDQGFRLTASALRQALTPRTKAVVLCAPCNPTGAVYADEELRSLADVLRGRIVWIITDEIYAGLTYDGFEQHSILQIAPDLRHRIIVVDGVSKRYAMTGWRVGWLLATERVARACRLVQSQATTNATTVAQHAAIAALTGPQRSIDAMCDAFRVRRDRLVKGLNETPGMRCGLPRGAFYAFANIGGLIGRRSESRLLLDDTAVAQWLLECARVAAVPGAAFGAPGYLRFSYALSLEEIERGLARMREAVDLLD